MLVFARHRHFWVGAVTCCASLSVVVHTPLSTANKYEYGFFLNLSFLSTLYETKDEITETPAPANNACGKESPNSVIGIAVALVEKNETFIKLSAVHFTPALFKDFLKLSYAGKNSSLDFIVGAAHPTKS